MLPPCPEGNATVADLADAAFELELETRAVSYAVRAACVVLLALLGATELDDFAGVLDVRAVSYAARAALVADDEMAEELWLDFPAVVAALDLEDVVELVTRAVS